MRPETTQLAEGGLIGAGAKLLGSIKVGEGAKVGAGTVLLQDLPPHVTAVGIPGRVVGKPRGEATGDSMDQVRAQGCRRDGVARPAVAAAGARR